MKNKRKENSIRSLVNLYTVVMGVSLSIGITSIINTLEGLNAVTPSTFFLFMAFVLTIVPFYHGALRHLDDAYIENSSSKVKNGVLIVDFMLLLLHAMAFVVLALLLKVANHFAWVLIVVLVIDVIWGVFVHFAASSEHETVAEWKWAIINTVFCLALSSYLINQQFYLEPLTNQTALAFLIFAACFIRTLADYVWGKEFYFPSD